MTARLLLQRRPGVDGPEALLVSGERLAEDGVETLRVRRRHQHAREQEALLALDEREVEDERVVRAADVREVREATLRDLVVGLDRERRRARRLLGRLVHRA